MVDGGIVVLQAAVSALFGIEQARLQKVVAHLRFPFGEVCPAVGVFYRRDVAVFGIFDVHRVIIQIHAARAHARGAVGIIGARAADRLEVAAVRFGTEPDLRHLFRGVVGVAFFGVVFAAERSHRRLRAVFRRIDVAGAQSQLGAQAIDVGVRRVAVRPARESLRFHREGAVLRIYLHGKGAAFVGGEGEAVGEFFVIIVVVTRGGGAQPVGCKQRFHPHRAGGEGERARNGERRKRYLLSFHTILRLCPQNFYGQLTV